MQKWSLFLIFSLLSFLSFAQVERKVLPTKQADSSSGYSDQSRVGKIEKKQLIRDLHLTKEQQTKMKEIHQSGKLAKEAIADNDKLTPAEKDEKIKALKKDQYQKTMNILNDEQKQKMKAMRGKGRPGKRQKTEADN